MATQAARLRPAFRFAPCGLQSVPAIACNTSVRSDQSGDCGGAGLVAASAFGCGPEGGERTAGKATPAGAGGPPLPVGPPRPTTGAARALFSSPPAWSLA